MKIKLLSAVTGISREKVELQKAYLKEYLSPSTRLVFEHLECGFPSIESETHAIYNAPGIVKNAVKAERGGCDGLFVNCFDDPGVPAIRELVKIPVYGGYLPAMLTAMALGERIGVITTDRDGILSEERKAAHLGFRDRVVAIEPVNLGVLELGNKDTLLKKLTEICSRYEKEHRIQAAILGCTGMYHIIDQLRQGLKAKGLNINVIEPLAAGVKFLETIIQLGGTNSLNCSLNMGIFRDGLDQ